MGSVDADEVFGIAARDEERDDLVEPRAEPARLVLERVGLVERDAAVGRVALGARGAHRVVDFLEEAGLVGECAEEEYGGEGGPDGLGAVAP